MIGNGIRMPLPAGISRESIRQGAGESSMKIIMINGPMGVGKTTVGRYIADTNPGTAFIDGDWCMDIHPFVGNRETRDMAADNILHMIGNYRKCSACSMVVLVWLMDDDRVYRKILEGISGSGDEVKTVTLVCDRENLISRWRNDRSCEWRTDEWLETSLKSLPGFAAMDYVIDTSGMPADRIAEIIMQEPGRAEYWRNANHGRGNGNDE